MKLQILWLCGLVVSAYAGEAQVEKLSLPNNAIRVLLSEEKLEAVDWHIFSNHGFIIQDTQNTVIEDQELHITYDNGFRLNNRHISEQFFITAQDSSMSFQEKSYPGSISLQKDATKAYLINHLDEKVYLTSVLACESVPTWPDEVQKALYIATRTYTFHEVAKRRKNNELYDLGSTVLSQVYKGLSNHTFDTVVQEVSDFALTIKGKPILAMYSAVCGSVIPAQKKTEVFDSAPYLQRPYACTHCEEQKNYRWESQLEFDKIESSLRELFPGLGTINDITIDGFDDAAIAQNVVISSDSGNYEMKAFDFRMRFYSHIKSLCCTFSTQNRILYAHGKGYGHHIGLCQWGAYYMVLKGSSYQEVLSFYYPDTELVRISLQEALLA